jgi:uncharacterized protein (TIGR00251 family)
VTTDAVNSIVLDVRVIPRAARSQIAGTRDEALLIRLNAPPVDGAANDELIRVLADLLDIPRRNIEIVSGHRARTKRVRITGVTSADLREKLCASPRTS